MGDIPGRKKEQAGNWKRWGKPSEHGAGLTPQRERGKADRGTGRKRLRLRPSYKKACIQAGKEPRSQHLSQWTPLSHRTASVLVNLLGSGSDGE